MDDNDPDLNKVTTEQTVTWNTTIVESVVVSMDQARATFGLGGTPDEALPDTLALLLSTRPGYLSRLREEHGQPVLRRFEPGTLHYKLTTIADDGYPYYPEP
jgi:hypothetical protein